jgi:hypothetical protein
MSDADKISTELNFPKWQRTVFKILSRDLNKPIPWKPNYQALYRLNYTPQAAAYEVAGISLVEN